MAQAGDKTTMKTYPLITTVAVIALLVSIRFAYPGDGGGKDGGPSGAFSYSKDAQVAELQKNVKAVVERYQDGLKSSDFSKIRPLFDPDAERAEPGMVAIRVPISNSCTDVPSLDRYLRYLFVTLKTRSFSSASAATHSVAHFQFSMWVANPFPE
jgi:hypothetical protein